MTENTSPASTPSSDASTIQVTLPAAEFALADLFERIPDARVKCDSAVATPAAHALLAVRTTERERAIDAAFQSDPNVGSADCCGERSDGWTYRVIWEGRPRRFIQRLVAAEVTLLSMQGRSGQWNLRLLAPDREGIAQAYEIMVDLGCGAECQSISTFEGDNSNHSELPDEQREAFVAAFEAGYYTIPRDATAEEVAGEVGISHQALSERLRRGYQQLIETELIVTDED
jgi:predicted DNA binding protein